MTNGPTAITDIDGIPAKKAKGLLMPALLTVILNGRNTSISTALVTPRGQRYFLEHWQELSDAC